MAPTTHAQPNSSNSSGGSGGGGGNDQLSSSSQMLPQSPMPVLVPSSSTFEAIQTLNLERIHSLSPSEVRFIIPALARMGLCNTLDVSDQWQEKRDYLLQILISHDTVNLCEQLSSTIDYHQLEADVKRELQYRFKSGAALGDSPLLNSIKLADDKPISEARLFEISLEELSPTHRIRTVLYVLINLMHYVRNCNYQPTSLTTAYHSPIFDRHIDLEQIVAILFYCISEMPSTFQLYEVVEALLLLKHGVQLICQLIANFPDSFNEICIALLNAGEKYEEDNFYSVNRVAALRALCQMNPNEALLIRGEAVEMCRMPTLVIMITLDYIKQNEAKQLLQESSSNSNVNITNNPESYASNKNSILDGSKADIISFITGILLSNDDKVRSWFSQFIKVNQSVKPWPPQSQPEVAGQVAPTRLQNSSLVFHEFRQVLLKRFREVTDLVANLAASSTNDSNSTSSSTSSKGKGTNTSVTELELVLTEACIMLRLYCALRGVASMKFLDEETAAICRLIICRPRHSYIGVRFVSFGLCTILAFPQLVTVTENESKIVDWIKWLVQEESYLGKVAGMKSSFGEMLLLIAIHFHSNQMSAIGELITSTIGLKLPIRINDLSRIKNIFTQEIFTDQMVAAHAVKVPVTRHLNHSVGGFLPVHCIYQLLKSRAFGKNKVPIKDWIFKQIRNSVAPIHPILPQLIEAYVNSILIPNTLSSHMTNEPIAEEDIAAIFSKRVYSFDEEDTSTSDARSDVEDEEDEDYETDSDEEFMDDDDTETEEAAGIGPNSFSKGSTGGGGTFIGTSNSGVLGATGGGGTIGGQSPQSVEQVACLLSSQLLLLYYVLLYEDVRLANMKNILHSGREVLKYSDEFMAELPIFYLVQKTRACQAEFGVLMPPLLRLLAFHYPHLCLVKDWLPSASHLDSSLYSGTVTITNNNVPTLYTTGSSGYNRWTNRAQRAYSIFAKREREKFVKAFKTNSRTLANNSGGSCDQYNSINDAFERLLRLQDEFLWPLAPNFISKLPVLLRPSVPRVIALNAHAVWQRLNHIFPTKLWVMTVNALIQDRLGDNGRHFTMEHSWADLVENPLLVLNCDRRVFRTPELMDITLHMLDGFLSANRTLQVRFMMEVPSKNEQEEKKREELRVGLRSLTESTALQCLLECCLLDGSDFANNDNSRGNSLRSSPTHEDSNSETENEVEDEEELMEIETEVQSRKSISNRAYKTTNQNGGVTTKLLSNQREVQGLICKHLHQCFIADPNLVKLVSYQGYRRELLPMMVTGVPSMHICLDFLPDLLCQYEMNKQIDSSFAIDLCSHLCSQYPISRYFGLARMCLWVANTHMLVLSTNRRIDFFLSTLPALERLCQVFPPLIDDFVRLLIQLAQKTQSSLSSRPTNEWISSLQKIELPPNLLRTNSSEELPVTAVGDSSGSVINVNSNISNTQRMSITKQLVLMDWTEFMHQVCTKYEPVEALALAIHKSFGMLCKLGAISKIYAEEDLN